MKKRSILLLLAVALLFHTAVSRLEEGRRGEDLRQLESALRRAAVSCYAAEGAYPPDVAYMQAHYGLRFDEDRYAVHYQLTASNWMPDITVLEKLP